MRKILLSIFIVFSISSFAQNDTTKYFNSVDYGWRYQRVKAKLALVLPVDTVANKLVGSVVLLNDVFYIKTATAWTTLSTSISTLTLGSGLTGTSYNGSAAVTAKVDTSLISTKANVVASLLGYAANALVVKYTDTASMLSAYYNQTAITSRLALKVNYTDTSGMLGNYIRTQNWGLIKTGQAIGADSSLLSTKANVTASLIGYAPNALVVKYTDTASMLSTHPNLTYVTANLATKFNITDTALVGGTNYYNKTYINSNLALYTPLTTNALNVKYSDTSTMLGNYVRTSNYGITKTGQAFGVDTSALSTKANVVALLTGYTAGALVVKYTDTASMLSTHPNKTYVDANVATKQNTLSLTTTGTSGAATLVGATLNIPNYAGGGMVYPAAGIAISTGTAWAASITDASANWNTAYTNRITSLTTTGTSGAATLTANVLNIPQYAGTVTSVSQTVPSFLSVAGSPITGSGTLAISYSGTALPIANGGTNLTALPTVSAASTFAAWDANKNISANNILEGWTTTATAGTTTTLLVGSTQQQYFTGTLTQTVTLPVVTTLVNGHTFYIINKSTGSVTVQTSGAVSLVVLPTNTMAEVTVVDNTAGTGTASWMYDYASINTTGGGGGVTTWSGGTTGLLPSTATSGAVTVTGTLIAGNGGTGQSSYAVGDLLSANTTSTLSKIADVAAGQPLLSGGVSTLPAYAGYTFSGTAAQTYTFPTTTKTLAANDGSNLTIASQAIGDILVSSSTTAYGRLADAATGNALISGGVGVAPSYGKIGLTTHITGTLPIGNGGTNSATALSGSSIMVSNGTNIVQGTAGTTTTLLHGNAAGTPTYSAVSLTADVSGTLPIGNGGTNVTSVTTAPTATAFAGWDANKNLSANNHLEGYTTTATAAGTTTLLVGSTYQQFFTGATTQTVVLPVATTLVNGLQYSIINNSSGVVTVQTSGANTVVAMAANTQLNVTCINTAGGTGLASWGWSYGTQNNTTITAGTTTNALTMNNGGAGAASGTTFNGSAAQTISYNTIGASPLAGSSSITTVGTLSSGSIPYSLLTGTPSLNYLPLAGGTLTGGLNGTAASFSGAIITTGSDIYMNTNNKYLYGRSFNNVFDRKLIGLNASDFVNIDPQALGTVFGGVLTGTSATFSSSVAVQSSTASSSTTTGALVVTGGVGVGGNVNIGGTLSATGAAAITGWLTLGSGISIQTYTVATLPAASQGSMVYVSDALAPTYNATVVGGGAVKTLVVHNGTAWTCH